MNSSLEADRKKIQRALVRVNQAIAAEQKQLARIAARLAALDPKRRQAA